MIPQPAPWRLEPRFVERIWGSRRLDPLFPPHRSPGLPIGEVWLTGEDCRAATGPFAGRTLAEAWRALPREAKGPCAAGDARFPLLAKFIFPAHKLSIQVHPDDDCAARLEAPAAGGGKTEMWHVVAAGPGAEVFAGLDCGLDAAALREALADGTIERRLRRFPLRTGDTIFIPAGTVHAIGPGSVLCEIQQQSDLTYRLYDYNRLGPDGRPRALHIEKALDAIRFGPTRAGRTAALVRRAGALEITYLAGCPYFAAERWEFAEAIEAAVDPVHFDLLIFLAGDGCLAARGLPHPYRAGEAWFLPADFGGYRLEPRQATTLLRAYLPELGALEACLLRAGFTAGQISGVVFR